MPIACRVAHHLTISGTLAFYFWLFKNFKQWFMVGLLFAQHLNFIHYYHLFSFLGLLSDEENKVAGPSIIEPRQAKVEPGPILTYTAAGSAQFVCEPTAPPLATQSSRPPLNTGYRCQGATHTNHDGQYYTSWHGQCGRHNVSNLWHCVTIYTRSIYIENKAIYCRCGHILRYQIR